MDGIISGKIEKNPDAINFVPDDNYVFERSGSDIYEAVIRVPATFDYQSGKWYLKVIEVSGQISLLHVKYITWHSPFSPIIATNTGKCVFRMGETDSGTRYGIYVAAPNSATDILTIIQNVQLGTLS